MSQTHQEKVVIIGSGPAGYTAAIYAARANLKPVMIAGLQPGGQMTITTDVENFPGFAEPIQGPWLMEQMRAQAEHVGTRIVYDLVTSVDFSTNPKKLTLDGGEVYLADTVIISTGAQARWLNLESEQKYKGYGVSACATCDGFFYRDKDVLVVGGGNSAVEESLFLANFCKSVTLIHRRDHLRAEKIGQDRLFAHPKVTVMWNTTLDEVLGDGKVVTGIRLRNIETGATLEKPMDGVFIAIGHDPATSVFKGHVDMDSDGYIITRPDSTATNIAGVYAAGDVKDKVYRQAITAAGMGCMAALEADRYLAHHGMLTPSDEKKTATA